MKTLVFVLFALSAFSCDAPNRSSEKGAGSETEERAPVDPAESEESAESSIHSDTTTSGGTNKQNQYDTLE